MNIRQQLLTEFARTNQQIFQAASFAIGARDEHIERLVAENRELRERLDHTLEGRLARLEHKER